MPRDPSDVFQPKPGTSVMCVCEDEQSKRRISIKTMPRSERRVSAKNLRSAQRVYVKVSNLRVVFQSKPCPEIWVTYFNQNLGKT